MCGKCDEIPNETDSPKKMFEYINSVVGISFYNDETYYNLLPSYYQHMVELGYYGFDTTPVKDLIKVVHSPTNLRFAPKNVDLMLIGVVSFNFFITLNILSSDSTLNP